ncbi:MAG: cation:proton antiporter [Actinobacteria bacterium]|nr:cation:proton antiporter [Actinomycetota bacterium]
MSETYAFGAAVAAVSGVGLLALLSNRLTERIRVPAPLLLLVVAAVVVAIIPDLHAPPDNVVERLVSIALALILFDGGLHMGWVRFRSALVPIAVVGVAGTFLTTAGAALFLHLAVGLSWYPSLLVAAAVAPTDPAVVFSVLGRREIAGRSATILEGESGANDPVGIALMSSLISAESLGAGPFAHVIGQFVLQMAIGGALGVIGGLGLRWFVRAVPLPNAGLHPLRTLACALILFGLGTFAHGSGFLAVFLAGILLGDTPAPYEREVRQFHAALASLGEIVAFVVLGLTVDLDVLGHLDVWLPGLALAVVVAILVRPIAVGLSLISAQLTSAERNFVLFAGLKGAVPILLGASIVAAHVPDASQLYGIVIIVVVASVLVQGSFTPAVATWLHLPVRLVEPEPWAVGLRLRDEPDNTHRFLVEPGSVAEGRRLDDLDDLPDGARLALVVRDGHVRGVDASTRLIAGDQILVVAEPEHASELRAIFCA